jgi:hypothetical protein
LRGADRADVSGGSAAYHDEVVCHKNGKDAFFREGDSRRNGGGKVCRVQFSVFRKGGANGFEIIDSVRGSVAADRLLALQRVV